MKIDLFTKGILTVIAVALVFIAIDTQPVKQAQAFGGGLEVISGNDSTFFVKKGNNVKQCFYDESSRRNTGCWPWVSIEGSRFKFGR